MVKDAEDGEVLRIECDNSETHEKIIDYLSAHSLKAKEEKVENVFLLEVISKRSKPINSKEESPCRIVPDSRLSCIIVVNHCSSDPEDEQKERTFILDFLRSLREAQIFPERFIFYNSGVKQLNDPILKAEINSFETCGSVVLISRRCAKLFKIGNDIKPEVLIDTEEIISLLTSRGRLIYL